MPKKSRETSTEIAAAKLANNTASRKGMSMAGSTLNPSDTASQRVIDKAAWIIANPERTTPEEQILGKNLIRRNSDKAAKALEKMAKQNLDNKERGS